jgi:hypothetical protein
MIGNRLLLMGGRPLLPSLSRDYLIDFTAMADGVPAAAATGEPTLRDSGGDANTKLATVSGGALICPEESGTGVTATYSGARLPEDIQSVYADVVWGSTSDSLGLISTMTPSLASVIASSCHVVFNYAGWALQYFSAGSINTVQTGAYPAVSPTTRYRVGWRVEGNDFYLRLPSGAEVGPITSAEAASRANHSLVFEHNRTVAGAPTLKILRVAATLFADPLAAGHTNLLTNQNNLAAWTRNAMGSPTTGLPDSDGGELAERVLETTATTSHYVLTSVDKAAEVKRYSLRAKIKLVGREWIALNAFDQAFSGQASRYLQLVASPVYGTKSGAFLDQAWMIYPLGSDWYQVQVDFKSNNGTKIQPRIATATADNTSNFAGDAAKGMIMFDQWLFERPV